MLIILERALGRSARMHRGYERAVKFSLTDKELSLSRENLIADLFAPVFYAIADDIDQNLTLRANDIPYFYFFAIKRT